jgi:hypothetical protein
MKSWVKAGKTIKVKNPKRRKDRAISLGRGRMGFRMVVLTMIFSSYEDNRIHGNPPDLPLMKNSSLSNYFPIFGINFEHTLTLSF